ncbi:H-NS family nucleoid-associated regulatory protein [Edwardsiella piscicida]|uniref:H-NS family histone-like protein n=1 Tax=Edwardsiella TaxID=635 RepID=UPI00054CC117|nr:MULTISPECIES: H-NS family nucleoid-associated regulatory protein [Edwardsiella]EGA8339571.1 H-NS histone family protein [Salmonella enterica subsp. enterica serovar Saintpaul]EKG9744537.1 H-NS histone family protein [Salmonella enterica]NJS89740.1 H-NS histone family protein [Escherichia coli]EKS7763299.1 H-NS histone family protein [Edwardsiella ictaluri]EKS7789714.1 H-NS histone family protein [Edwardsiella ictaluri]
MKDSGVISQLSVGERRELVIAELKRKHRIRTLFKGLPVSEVREIIERMQGVCDELEVECKRREEDEKERRSRAEKIMNDMISSGVDIEFLSEVFTSKSEGSNAKYVKDGITWSGYGRRPEAFKGLTDIELERFRIHNAKSK